MTAPTHPVYHYDDGTLGGPVLVGDPAYSKRHGVSGIIRSVSSDTVAIEIEDDWQSFRIKIDDLRYGAPKGARS